MSRSNLARMRSRRASSALIEAVEACGKLLVDHGIERAEDDVNELADGPRLSDE